MRPLHRVISLALLALLVGCNEGVPRRIADSPPLEESPSRAGNPERGHGVTARPAWLGRRVLPLRPDGFGEVRPTPKLLRNRRLPTIDLLPRPQDDGFFSSISAVPDEVRVRSTWKPACPVSIEELRYVRVSFWGFDRQAHMGELILHKTAVPPLIQVFRALYREQFPIEEMRVVAAEELDAPPTGDGNNTTAFVCRPARGSTTWSQHAYGLAIDINPFHNPYERRDLVLPELASSYTNRNWKRPGMILDDGPVVAAFDEIGWGWGGGWNSLVDYMHFSANGR